MFEHMTYEVVLRRMLDRVTTAVDKREGSVIWDAQAPAAAELAQLYIELDVILQETYADTASRPYLIKRAKERGLEPLPAKHAVLRGEFNIDVSIGARFSLEMLDYVVLGRTDDGIDWRVQCETAGAIGNRYLGSLIPIDHIPGLTRAELTEVLVPGEDEEETEVFRRRYFNSFNPDAYGGNIQDYKDKVHELQGVGGVKVYPVWNGGGTVKLVIQDSLWGSPTQDLLNVLQTAIDPEGNQGLGYGVAPIGHVVTVLGAEERPVDISTRLVFQDGYSWERLQEPIEAAVDAYLLELRQEWEDTQREEINGSLVVRVSQLETRVLSVTGILDILDTTLGGSTENLILGPDEIPVRGEFHATGG